MLSENPSPVALAGAYRLGVIMRLPGAPDTTDVSPDPLALQAFRVRQRVHVSWSVARVVAELAFASGRA
jgi:hypothetical protein